MVWRDVGANWECGWALIEEVPWGLVIQEALGACGVLEIGEVIFAKQNATVAVLTLLSLVTLDDATP